MEIIFIFVQFFLEFAPLSGAGVSINFGTSGQFSISGKYYFGRPSFLGKKGT